MPPIDPVSIRAIAGQYAARQADGRCVVSRRRLLRSLARESGSRLLAMVYVAALFSQQVALVGNSPRRPPERSRNGMHDTELPVPLGGVVAVSSEAWSTASTLPPASSPSFAPSAPSASTQQHWLPGVMMVTATEVATPQHFHAQHRLFIVKDDARKSAVFAAMAQVLLQGGQIEQALADHLMLAWRCENMGMPVCVAPVASQLLSGRDKRISMANREQQVMAHIEENCAMETEIMDLGRTKRGQVAGV